MSDMLLELANRPATARVVKALGLPTPVPLARATGGYEAAPWAGKNVLVGAAPGGRAERAIAEAVAAGGAEPAREGVLDAVAFDATGLTNPGDLKALYDFFHPIMRRLARNARILVVAAEPAEAPDALAAAVCRGVEGFVRSLAKEVGKRGATANLAYVAAGAEDRLGPLLRFFATARCTYVSGQAVHVSTLALATDTTPQTAALAGKVALVTGAARGIGEATAARLAEEGAHVVCLDMPGAAGLEALAARLGGTAHALDVTAPGAPEALSRFLLERFGGVDVVVHNAGVTRDKTLAKMTPEAWETVVAVNLEAIAALDAALDASGALRDGGRVVCLSSISGLAGNFGQTNYAATKAALVGYAAARAAALAGRGVTVNAVAPGFIETPMTARIPFATREAGRRLNSLSQGGLPRDVAEMVTFLATPGASGLTGQTIRVCGQGLIGA